MERITEELKNFEQSVFKSDFCVEKLKRELGVDAIDDALPHVTKVTSIRTISVKPCTLTPTGKCLQKCINF